MVSLRRSRLAGFGCAITLLAAFAPAQGADTAVKVEQVSISPETLMISPGKPLSVRALVTHPAPLQGVASWTLESRRHRGTIMAMSPSPDGKLVATGGIDGTIRIWDVGSGELVRALVGHGSYVYSLSWSPDGNSLASAGTWDGTIRIWDARNGMPLRTFKGHVAPVMHVVWSPDGTRLAAAGGHSGWVWLWNARSDHDDKLLEVGVDVYSVSWSPSCGHLAISMTQNPTAVVDLSVGKTTHTLGEPGIVSWTTRWSPDGTRLAIGTSTKTSIWDWENDKVDWETVGASYSVAWSPDGATIATAASGGNIQLFDVTTKKRTKILDGAAATGLVWREAEQLVVRGLYGISAWQPTAGKRIYDYAIAATNPPIWTAGRPFVAGLGTKKLSLYDTLTAKVLKTLEGHTAPVTTVSWNRDNKTLASGGADKVVCVWDTVSGKLLRSHPDHTAALTSVAWSPDGKTLATGGQDSIVRLWSIAGKPEGTLEGHPKGVTELAWAPRGNLIAAGGADAVVKLWDIEKSRVMREINAFQPVQSLAWNFDGSLLAGGTTDQLVRVWQTSNGQAVANLRMAGNPPSVTALAWSADGKYLLAGRGNHTVQLWDPKVEKPIHSIQAMAPVQYVAWGTGGSMIVAGNNDRTVRFWEANTAELRGLSLAEDDHLVIVGADGHYRVDTAKQKEVDLVYVAQTAKEQLTLKPEEFAIKFRWRNIPAQVKVTGK